MPPITPQRILETGFAFWPARILQSAVELRLFTVLGEGAMTGAELNAALELHDRANPDFYDTLLALGFLERDGDGPTARYRNTPETGLFLDQNRPEYVGGIVEMANERLYKYWGGLTEGLRSGEPQTEVKHLGENVFAKIYKDEHGLQMFLNAMTGASRGNFLAFAELFDFTGVQTLCDVGGALGVLSEAVARRHPQIACTTTDLPNVVALARKRLDAVGIGDRVATKAVDFFADPLPTADVITMGMILHDWNLEKKMQLIRAAYDALPVGGRFVVIENLIDDARRENAFGLMMSLNMMIEFGDSFDYTGADFAGWCREVGFSRTEVLHLAGPCSAGIAWK